jgi:hypothetical protein
MAKKSKKKVPEISSKGKTSGTELEKTLIENFVNLQKVLTNLSVKFDTLSDKISDLLQLFEISAKSFAEKHNVDVGERKTDKEFLEKLNTLLDQNKTIAKGLTLMGGRLREKIYGQQPGERRFTRPQ